MIAGDQRQSSFPEASGTYHMTAAGQTTWHEFANAILEEARRAPQNLPWLASAIKGRPLIASRVLPISTEEFPLPARRPSNSVLSNARLKQVFGVTLPDWRTQLHQCFASRSYERV
jgi:dTDP-4-dehydrorhamnose reductase